MKIYIVLGELSLHFLMQALFKDKIMKCIMKQINEYNRMSMDEYGGWVWKTKKTGFFNLKRKLKELYILETITHDNIFSKQKINMWVISIRTNTHKGNLQNTEASCIT